MPFGSHAFLNQQKRYYLLLPDMQMQSDPKKVAMVHFRVDYTIYGTRPQVKVNIMAGTIMAGTIMAGTIMAGTANNSFPGSCRPGKTQAH